MESPPKAVRELVGQFEDAWHADTVPEIATFVGERAAQLDPAARRLLVVRLIQIDLEYRWKAWAADPAVGKDAVLEKYAARLPDLGPAAGWPAELVLAEYRARRLWGDAPDAEAFLARFPSRREELLPGLREIDTEAQKAVTGAAGPCPRRPGATPTVPGYEILEELGRGGMGVVYRARHVKLDRPVALKMVLVERMDRGARTRFLGEAAAVAAIGHPNVVQVYDYGESDGSPFMALEFCPGGTLADQLKGTGAVPVAEAVRLVGRIARGVAAAHDQGIVHRDLKPGNVLLGDGGEPKVADFGLAKRGMGEELTRTGVLMGTPAYMAPEQADGGAKFVGPQADVWALGVILYECVAGKRPFTGDTVEVLLSRIRSAEPVQLRSRMRGVSRDLDTIVSKCLAKEPERRYPSAAALADDLDRFARGEPITARPAGRAERVVRWVRREPTAAAAYGFSSLAVVLALVVFVVFGFWREAEGAKADAVSTRDQLAEEKKRADTARDEAIQLREHADTARSGEASARRQAEEATERVARLEYARSVNLAYRTLQEGYIERAAELLTSCRTDLRGWEWWYIHRLCQGLRVYPGVMNCPGVLSGSGRRLVKRGADGTVQVWDTVSGEKIRSLSWKGEHQRFSISHDDDDPQPTSPASVWRSEDGGRVLTRDSAGMIRVLNAQGDEVNALDGKRDEILAVAMSRDGRRIVTGNRRGFIRVLDADRLSQEFVMFNGYGGEVSVSDDGRWIAASDINGNTRVWDTQILRGSAPLGGDAAKNSGDQKSSWATVSGDGNRVAVGAESGVVRVWDTNNGSLLCALPHPKSPLPGSPQVVGLSSDGRRAVTVHGGMIWVWKTDPGLQLSRFKGPSLAWDGMRPFVQVSADGNWVVTSGPSGGGTIGVWYAEMGLLLCELKTGDASTGSLLVAVSGNGQRVVGANRGGRVWVWDSSRNNVPRTFGGVGKIVALTMSADGRLTATSDEEGAVRVYDNDTGSLRHTLKTAGATYRMMSLGFSGDGRRLITAGLVLQIWDAEAGTELLTLQEHGVNFWMGALSTNGERLCGNQAGSIIILDGKPMTRPTSSPSTQTDSGEALLARGDILGAVAAYRNAIQSEPNVARTHDALARLLATGPTAVRDGKAAIAAATKACVLDEWKSPAYVETLAAAHAEAGDFGNAIEHQKRVLSYPEFGPNSNLAAGARQRLDLYTRKTPYRDLTLAPGGASGTDPGSDRKVAEYVLGVGGEVRVNGGDWGIKSAANLPKDPFLLTSINLHGNKQVTATGLVHLRGCKYLKVAWFNNSAVNDVGLTHLTGLPVLAELHLHNTPVTDKGLAHFAGCTTLTRLNVGSTKATDAGLAHFKGCTGLTHAWLYNIPLTDAALAQLGGCKNLAHLELDGTRVTDAGLAHLKGCDKLRVIQLRRTTVTPAGVEELSKTLPKCKIEHDGGTIQPK